VKEVKTVASPIYNSTNVTELFQSTNDEHYANHSETVSPQAVTVTITVEPSAGNVAENIEQINNSMTSNSMEYIIDGTTSALAGDPMNASGYTEDIVAKIDLSSDARTFSEVTTSSSHDESLETHAYTRSKIPPGLEPSVETQESSVRTSKEDNPQQDIDSRVHEEHRTISKIPPGLEPSDETQESSVRTSKQDSSQQDIQDIDRRVHEENRMISKIPPGLEPSVETQESGVRTSKQDSSQQDIQDIDRRVHGEHRMISKIPPGLEPSVETQESSVRTSKEYSPQQDAQDIDRRVHGEHRMISKIPPGLEPSVEAQESAVRTSKEYSPQQDIQDIDRRAHEEHRMIPGTQESVFSPADSPWVKKSDTFVAVSDALTPGNLLFRHAHHSKPVTYDNDTEEINSLFNIVANRIEGFGFNKIQFTYLMVGLFVFTISLVFLGFLCHNPRDPKSKQDEGPGAKISNTSLHVLLISLMAIFFLLYVGLEVTYGQLVLAFATHGELKLTQSTGLVIAVVFWGSFAAMRFASIFFSSGFCPITILLLNFVFCTFGTIILSTMASRTETALWVGTALLGIGLASVFPTAILWIQRYIHISNKIAAAFVMGASLGEMTCPLIVYRLMVSNPAMLMHSAVFINVLCILTFTAIRWLAVQHGEKYCVDSNNGYHLASQDEEEEMIDTPPPGGLAASCQHDFLEHRALLNGNPHRGP
jgi:hypothetical protein